MGEVVTMRFPIERGDLIALAYRVGDVLESVTEEDAVALTVKLQSKAYASSASRLEPYIVK
jgi:GTP-binding protein HflX